MIEPRIKLIVTDLDGTYIFHRSISQENKRAVERAQANGVKVMACTGRCWAMCDDLIPTLGFDEYVVTSNGASIFNAQSGKIVYSSRLKPDWLPAFFEAAWASGCPFDVYCGPYIHTYTPRRSQWTLRCEAYASEHPNEQTIKFRHFSDYPSWYEATKDRAELFRVEVPPGMPCPAELQKTMADCGIKNATMSFVDHWDICHPDTSKANAIDFVCKELRIHRENVMALGDSGNDIEMLRYAGIGVAMGSGTKEAQEAADVVSPDDDENGFAWAVHRFVLGNSQGQSNA